MIHTTMSHQSTISCESRSLVSKLHCLETVWKGLSCLENFSFPDGSRGIIGDKGLARSVFPDMHNVTIVIKSSG